MSVTAVVGAQFGDEGKGKIVDYLSEKMDIVARCTGGNNAGHSILYQGREFVSHLIPGGFNNPNAELFICPGTVIHPESLVSEIEQLESMDIEVRSRLKISGRS